MSINIIPTGGLSNKLRVIFSYYAKAKKINKKLYVLWNECNACNGFFLNYFEPIENIVFNKNNGKCDYYGYDVLQEYYTPEMYNEINSNLANEWRLRAHNQYLSFAVAFGWPGLLFFMFVLLFSVRYACQQQNYIYLAFLIIAIGSFFNEDTLETQAGVTFFAFLNAIFLWGKLSRVNGS